MSTNEAEALDRLLGAELSALHSYEHLMKQFEGPEVACQATASVRGTSQERRPVELDACHLLDRLRRSHAEAAQYLRDLVKRQGKEPTAVGTPWILLLSIAESTPGLLSSPVTLKAIKEGEQRGVDECEAVLNHGDLDEDCRALIRDRVLPRWREHLTILGRYLRNA